jgi:hypothetical protein
MATYIDPFGIAKQADAENPEQLSDEEEAELVGELNSLLADTKKARQVFDSDVSFKRAFISGNQLVGLDETSQEYLRVVTMRSPDKFPAVDNKLLSIYRAWIGRCLKAYGQPGVRPRNGTFKETVAATGMSTYLEHVFDKEDLLLKLAKVSGIIAYAPAAYMRPYWDRDGGETIAWCRRCDYVGEEDEIDQTCPQCLRQEIMRVDQALMVQQQSQQELATLGLPPQEALIDPDNPPEFQQENMPDLVGTQKGELKIAQHRWDEIAVDPGALEPTDVRYFFVETPLPLNVVRTRHPLLWKRITADDIVSDRYLERDGANLYYRTRTLDNHVWYREYHEMPSALFPHGRIISFCNNYVLEIKENIYAWLAKRPDLYWFRGDVFDNSILGIPWAEHAINLQREHNKLVSQMRALRELTLYPILVGEESTGITKKTEMAKPGERILLRRGTTIQPYYLKNPPLPSYVDSEAERLRLAMQEKAGVTDNEMGVSPPGQSGRDNALNEAASDRTTQSIALANTSEWRQLNEAILQIGWYFTDSQEEWVVKRGGRTVAMSWSTIGVRPKRGKVYIVQQDIMTRNPVLRLALAERLLQDGVLGDKETGRPDPKKFMEVAGLMDIANFNDEDEDERYATQIPELIKAGVQITPQPEDRAQVIADTLLDWLRSDGRYAPEEETQKVRDVWLSYAMALIQHMQSMGMGMTPDMLNSIPMTPGPAPQTNPTAMAPGIEAGMGGGRNNAPSIPGKAESAGDKIKQADRAGEVASRMTKKKEGATI